MRNDIDLIFQSYLKAKTPNKQQNPILTESVSKFYSNRFVLELQEAYRYDLECIDQIIEEGRIGDALSKFAGGVSDAAGKVKEFAKGKWSELAQPLINKIIASITPDAKTLGNFLVGLDDISKNPQKLEQKANELDSRMSASEASEEYAFESFKSNKQFLAENIFTESNIEELFYSVITEAAKKKAAVKPTAKPAKPTAKNTKSNKKKKPSPLAGRQTVLTKNQFERKVKDFKEVVDEYIAKKSPEKQRAIRDKTASQITGEEQPKPEQSAASQAKQFKPLSKPKTIDSMLDRADMYGGLVPRGSNRSYDNTEKSPEVNEPEYSYSPEPEVSPESDYAHDFTSSANPESKYGPLTKPEFRGLSKYGETEEPQKEGLLKKIWGWVKNNKGASLAAVAIPAISAIALAIGGWPMLAPLLVKGLAAGGLNAAKYVVGGINKGGKFSWGDLGKAVLKGAGLGMAGGALFSFVGHELSNMFDGNEPAPSVESEPTEEFPADFEPPKAMPHGSDADFEKLHGSAMDSGSKLDNATSWKDDYLRSQAQQSGGKFDSRLSDQLDSKLQSLYKKNPNLDPQKALQMLGLAKESTGTEFYLKFL